MSFIVKQETIHGQIENLPELHSVALFIAGKLLSEDRLEQVIAGLKKLDRVENEEVISVLATKGALPPSVEQLQRRLDHIGIYVGLMTPEEAQQVADYAFNATEGIKRQKAERIRDIVYASLNGKRHRRDYNLVEEKRQRLEEILEKYELYERGGVDVSRGFDPSVYITGGLDFGTEYDTAFEDIKKKSYKEYGVDVVYDTYSSYHNLGDNKNLEHIFQSLDDDELIEFGYVDVGDLYCYAPYTYNDLEDLELYSSAAWSDVTDFRHKTRLAGLLEEYVPSRSESLESGLNRDFIARTVLVNRRMRARDLLTVISSFGIELLGEQFKNADKDLIKALRRSLSYCSYYISQICGISKQEMLKKYKTARPVSAEFFQRILDCVESWTEAQEQEIDADFAAYLIKLDDHLFYTEVLYVELSNGTKDTQADNQAVGLLALLD